LSAEAHANLRIIHAVQAANSLVSRSLALEEWTQSEERQQAHERIDALQRRVGSRAPIQIAVGQIKQALVEAARQSDADLLIIGRDSHSGVQGRLRDLTYAMVRDSPYPVLSV
jgi:nucleotide-binding universal stress UspA family protein